MAMEPSGWGRRRVLKVAAETSVVGTCGCVARNGRGAERPEGVFEDAFETGPVPDQYRTADSQAGERRDPDSLVTQEAVQLQGATEAVEAGLAEQGHTCENCVEFIHDRNGDGFGACAKVDGYVDADDWCSLWESVEEHETGK